jgi:hypothetical protein
VITCQAAALRLRNSAARARHSAGATGHDTTQVPRPADEVAGGEAGRRTRRAAAAATKLSPGHADRLEVLDWDSGQARARHWSLRAAGVVAMC